MTRYVLDANLVLRFLRDDHPTHSPQAKSLFEAASSGACVLVLPSVVLAECVWVLGSHYGVSAARISQTLIAMLTKPGVKTDEPEVAIDALERMAGTGLDYVDCYLAARAVQDGHTVASFDQDFRKFKDVKRWKGKA